MISSCVDSQASVLQLFLVSGFFSSQYLSFTSELSDSLKHTTLRYFSHHPHSVEHDQKSHISREYVSLTIGFPSSISSSISITEHSTAGQDIWHQVSLYLEGVFFVISDHAGQLGSAQVRSLQIASSMTSGVHSYV